MIEALTRYGRSLSQLFGDRRKSERRSLVGIVTATCMDRYGRLATHQCFCMNISEGGLAMVSPAPIVMDAEVYVRSDGLNVQSSASVRHCEPRASSFLIGLDFRSEPCIWVA